jgi:hypothetical protein
MFDTILGAVEWTEEMQLDPGEQVNLKLLKRSIIKEMLFNVTEKEGLSGSKVSGRSLVWFVDSTLHSFRFCSNFSAFFVFYQIRRPFLLVPISQSAQTRDGE